MNAAKRHLDHLWTTRSSQPTLVIDEYFGRPAAQRSLFKDSADAVRTAPYKLLDPHLADTTIRDLATTPALMHAVGDLLGARPLVCNSLLFEWGSQQDAHFDTFFMPPKTPNMMAATWIAIDPVTPENGPLYYYPKSHLIEPYRFSHGGISAVMSELQTGAAAHIETTIQRYGLKKSVFLPNQGDVLIWHAQLLHGGSAIRDPRATRCSLVTHYFTERDFPDADHRIDLGDDRWILKRDPSYVINKASLAEAAAFIATLTVTDAMRAAVPASFDAQRYLAANQDVLRAGINPWTHYIEYGRAEGRAW
jgi:ectoine hydroxylase-related dioxygenase (phytanoyl-CoA dioxygenase family)